MKSIAFLRRDPATAAHVQAILGLPDDAWTDVEIRFALDTPSTATVTLLLGPHQLRALAQLATPIGGDA